MAENTIEKLEERLANATVKFKEMKEQLDAKNMEIEFLKTQVSNLEDELALEGGAKGEVEGLKERLEKAKEIFATQKARITELTELNNAHVSQITELTNKVSELEDDNADLNNMIEQIRGIVTFTE